MTIASGFNGNKPISCAQGRYNDLIIVQGGGVTPKRWTGTGTCTNAGIVAPSQAPTVVAHATKRYYVARVDVTKPGACYNAPPAVTFATPAVQPAGFKAAKATSYLSQSSVGEVIVTEGGKYYPDPPAVSLSATHGTGATFTATLDGTPPSATGLHHWEIVEGPPFADETELMPGDRSQFSAWRPVTLNIPGTGSTSDTFNIIGWDCASPTPIALPLTLSYSVTGAGAGSGCQIRIGFYGASYWTVTTEPTCVVGYSLAWGVSGVTVINPGSGYSESSVVRVEISASGAGKKLVLEGCTPGNARNTTTPRFKIASIAVNNQGSGYNVAPEIKIKSTTGFGAYAESTVAAGKVTAVSLESGGGGYRTVPAVTAVSGEAEAFAVARPHLRGKYQCYYRYIDDTAEANGGPIPSNLSPVTEVDTGEGTQRIDWTVQCPTNTDGRALSVELWRTTGNQATTLYHVATLVPPFDLPTVSWLDDLTDEEVRDANRQGYAAMPIVLPNGELNAMRFVPPPTNKAVAVRFQDRIWYGVDTSGSEPNSVYFSEVDEPESVPDVNEFVLQQNARDGDSITALVPFGSSLLIMQNRRCYSLSYAKKPLLDANVTPIAYRGCLSQRCWDTHGGLCYVMDRYGVYAISPSGQSEDLSAPIADLFRTRIDFSNSTWNFVVVDPKTRILRAFVSFSGDLSAGYPTRVLCYSLDAKAWWIERHPHRITAGVPALMSDSEYRCVYAARGGMYLLDHGAVDIGRGSITEVTLTNRGAGYRKAPVVTVTGASGAELQAVVDGQGRVGGIWILSGGYDAANPTITISAPDDPTCTAPVQATATCVATSASTDVPLHLPYRFKTGNYEYPTDANKSGDVDSPRSVSITYKPQPSACEVALRMYYNNSDSPRPNVAPRNRGVGFRASVPDAAARLDMGKLTVAYGSDSGVARSVFSGKTLEDIQSADRHVAVEIVGARRTASPVIVYQLDAFGTVGGE